MSEDKERRARKTRRDPRAEPESSAPDADIVEATLARAPVLLVDSRRTDTPTLAGTPAALNAGSQGPGIAPPASPLGRRNAVTVPSMKSASALPPPPGLPLGLGGTSTPTMPSIPSVLGPRGSERAPARRDSKTDAKLREAAAEAEAALGPQRKPTQARMKVVTLERDALAAQIQQLERRHQDELTAVQSELARAKDQLAEALGAPAEDPRVPELAEAALRLSGELERRSAHVALLGSRVDAALEPLQKSVEQLQTLREQLRTVGSELLECTAQLDVLLRPFVRAAEPGGVPLELPAPNPTVESHEAREFDEL